MRPETLYARSGSLWIAYQVIGDGPFDLVYVPGFLSHVELRWNVPSFGRYLGELGEFSRLILFDKRGTGMSDRVSGAPTLEARMDDLRAVMDAVGSTRAAIFGVVEGAPMSLLFAATYPDRVAALAMRSGFPRTMWAPDYPWGSTEEHHREQLNRELRLYARRTDAEASAREFAEWEDAEIPVIVDYLRWCGSPGAVEALAAMNREIDVRHVLPAVRVATLVLHGQDDAVARLEASRWMAEPIPGARFVEVPGASHFHFGRGTDVVNREVRSFFEDLWTSGRWDAYDTDRVLATVLFTDIVDSSRTLAGAGEVLVSSTVKDLVAGSGTSFVDRGAHELKGVPGEWQLYAVDRVTA